MCFGTSSSPTSNNLLRAVVWALAKPRPTGFKLRTIGVDTVTGMALTTTRFDFFGTHLKRTLFGPERLTHHYPRFSVPFPPLIIQHIAGMGDRTLGETVGCTDNYRHKKLCDSPFRRKNRLTLVVGTNMKNSVQWFADRKRTPEKQEENGQN